MLLNLKRMKGYGERVVLTWLLGKRDKVFRSFGAGYALLTIKVVTD
jgi:hypothetical protein